jgi:Domain of unknown function (DUF1905)/Bacteriocin-protection, YdeI or OmpD-Associated
MPPKSFTATLQRPEGVGTWTYLTVPFDVLAEYGVKGQVKVQGTINGAFFRGSLMPHGDGRHFLVVKKSLRDQARAAQGSVVKVRLDRDTDPRTVSLPRDLKQALAANPPAAAAFKAMPPSHKQEYLDYITEAKKDATRARRISVTIERLAAGAGRLR